MDPYGWKEHENIELKLIEQPCPVEGFEAMLQGSFQIGKRTLTGFSGVHDHKIYLGKDRAGAAVALVDSTGDALVLHVNEWSTYVEKEFERDVDLLQKWQTMPLDQQPVIGEFRFRLTKANPESGEPCSLCHERLSQI